MTRQSAQSRKRLKARLAHRRRVACINARVRRIHQEGAREYRGEYTELPDVGPAARGSSRPASIYYIC